MTATLEKIPLRNLVELLMGQAPSSKDCNFDGRGTPFVKVGEFGETRPIIREWTTNPLRMAQRSDVLLCVVGATCGKINLGADCAIGRSVAAIRPHPSKLDQFYLYYFMMTLVEGLRAGSVGAAQTVISKEMVQSVEIPSVSLGEQQRIVGILDEAFEGIATAKANAEQNLQNARALFESHLQSVFTQRGEGWVEKQLQSLGEIRTGKRDANHQVENGPYPFYTCAFGQFKSPTFSFDGPSIILPGNGANVGKVFFHDGKFEAYQRTYVVNELSQCINPRFLYFCFSANWPGWIATKQFGSATNYIVVGDLKAFPVPTPSLPVQKRTVEQLESFTEETQRLATIYERKLAALDDLKKSLLHQAFTGEL